ncbi:MAG: prepilin-type N-terminal cleavage/methylation domain-containing protein, partial [Desulfatiglandales bacterium]
TNLRKKSEGGFTLIELMIVIAIIGILAAIAIPQFSAYRQRSYNSAAQADLRNAATAQEAYFVDWSTYCDDETVLQQTDYGFFLSEVGGKTVTFEVVNADNETYEMEAFHESGSESYTITGPGGSIDKK